MDNNQYIGLGNPAVVSKVDQFKNKHIIILFVVVFCVKNGGILRG